MRYTQLQLIDEKGLNTMKLHDLLKQVSDILDPDGGLYDYFLHTFDDNCGFLRTRHQWWAQEVADKEIPELSRVLICFYEEFDADGVFYRIDFDSITDGTVLDRLTTNHKTMVKCQLFYDSDDDDSIQSNLEFSIGNRFEHAYLVDLTNKTYSVYTLPVVDHKNLIVLELDSVGRFCYGWYYDNLGVEYDLKSTINRGMFVDTVLIIIDDPEIDAFQSFVCRYRLRADGGVEFYPNKHDLMVRDKCRLIVNGVDYDKNG